MPITLPFHSEKETQINSEQKSYTVVDIDTNGLAVVHSKYWNDERIDGDHYTTVVAFLDDAGAPLAALKQVKGVNPKGFGNVNEVTSEERFRISSNVLNRAARIEISHSQWDSVDDDKLWQIIIKIATEVAKQFMNSKDSGYVEF